MRTRNKVIAHTTTDVPAFTQGAFAWFGSGTSGSSSDATAHYARTISNNREESWMIDGVSGGKRPKGCTHWKAKLNLASVPGSYLHGGRPGGTGYTSYNTNGSKMNLISMEPKLNALMPSPEIGNWPRVSMTWAEQDERQIIQKLYDKARKPVVDGLLNLVESPEIPSAISAMVRDKEFRTQRWTKMFDGRYSKGLKNLTGSLSNKYLAYSFGIAPVISDIIKVCSYMERIKKDYEKYATRSVRRVSFVSNGSCTFNTTVETASSNTVWSYQGFATYSPVSRYVLTYRDRNPYTNKDIAKLDFLLRRFGSAGPASFAWERIPFSFVVDWFIDTASILNTLDVALGMDPIETISLTRSRKIAATVDCFKTVRRSDTNAIVQDHKVGSVETSYYLRTPLERTTYVGLSDRFGKKQLLLTLALLRQLA